MRILHLVHQYLPEHVGGTELYTRALARRQVAHGHSVAIFAPTGGDAVAPQSLATEEGVRVYRAPAGQRGPAADFAASFGQIRLRQAVQTTLDAEQPDLVHVEHLKGLPARLLDDLQERAIPYVITLWDFWWVCANAQLLTNYSQEVCDGPRAYLNCARCALARVGWPQFAPALPVLALPLAARRRLLQPGLAGAARLIAPAAFVRDWYVAHGAPEQTMVVAPPGIDAPQRPAAAPRPAGRPLQVGYIGGLSQPKGVHVLLKAFQALPAAEAELRIAGDLTADPDYVRRLRQAAGANATFLGRQSRSQIWQLLADLDVVVVTSLWYETFCFVISEAHAAAVPVVASDLGVLAERVRHGKDGLLFTPGEDKELREMLTTLAHRPERLTSLQQGIKPVASMDEHAAAIEAIYAAAIAGQPGP